MTTNRCMVCGREYSSKPLITLEHMPASAQDLPDQCHLEEEKGIPLSLYQCDFCGLVQFACEPVPYYKDVIRSGGFSTTMVELRKGQYQTLIRTYGLEGKRFFEAGCGRGEFLKVLSDWFPVEAYGMEHREELVELAVGDGLKVFQGFTEEENQKLENKPGQSPYDVFLSFNFLEHQPDPGKMLRCIYGNLTEEGMGLITVPSLEYILEHDGYYELIRDHLAYYTFDTLRFLLESNGFLVLEEEMVNRDTLSVTVKKIPDFQFQPLLSRPKPSFVPVDISGLRESLVTITGEVDRLVSGLREENKTLAIWGASHQGFTLAATTGLGSRVRYIIDSAPFKQGRYSPASHIPILSPDQAVENPVDAILIVAPGYTQEIATTIRTRFCPEVRIITLRSSHLEEL